MPPELAATNSVAVHSATHSLFVKSASSASAPSACATARITCVEPAYRLPIGMVDGRQAFATLSQLRNIDSKRLVKKIVHLDADIL
jgi:hypothetical protein